MSLKSLATKAVKEFASSQSHSHAHHRARPGTYRPGDRKSPKAAAAETAVREIGKFLRKR